MLSDWQGSTRATVGGTGFIKSRQDFTAFGEEIGAGTGLRTAQQGFGGSNNIRQKYALTERDDATGLDNTRFRKNESKAGRWTSPDPYNGSASIGDPQSFNRYSYVQNDPTNFVDPSGLNLVNYFCYDLNTFWRYGDLLSGVATTTMCYFTPAGDTDSGGSIDSGGGGGGGGGGRSPLEKGLDAARRALQNPDCSSLFTNLSNFGFKSAVEVLNTYEKNNLIRVGSVDARGSRFKSAGTGANTTFATGSYPNANGIRVSANVITINSNGFFITGRIGNGTLVNTIRNGGFENLKMDEVRGAVIIHELAHATNNIPNDDPVTLGDNSKQSMANAQLVRKKCF